MLDLRTPTRLIRDLITKGLGKQSFYFQFDDLITLKFHTDDYEVDISTNYARDFSRINLNGEVFFIPVVYDREELLKHLKEYLEHLEIFYNVKYIEEPDRSNRVGYAFIKKYEP
jgi:hypothetical protein